jgi:hypothetical protein
LREGVGRVLGWLVEDVGAEFEEELELGVEIGFRKAKGGGHGLEMERLGVGMERRMASSRGVWKYVI